MTYATSNTASLEYRRAATQQASPAGLVVALYDTLIGDLRRAIEAMDRNDIQARCDQLVHGFKVLQQLDAMVDMVNGGETAISLRRFYSHLRGQMLSAQFKLSSEILQEQIRIIFEVRQAWQQVDSSPTRAHHQTTPGSSALGSQGTVQQSTLSEIRQPFSCVG